MYIYIYIYHVPWRMLLLRRNCWMTLYSSACVCMLCVHVCMYVCRYVCMLFRKNCWMRLYTPVYACMYVCMLLLRKCKCLPNLSAYMQHNHRIYMQ